MLIKYSNKRWIAILTVLLMILSLTPAMTFGETTEPEPNYAFIPNSGEASVSKVDLVNMTEVARYYTEPRGTIAQDYNWRTSRIAMDADGNAWVLNTGADGTGLQGSVVRIQADTTGLSTTNTDPAVPLAFGTDEAVKVFNVGSPGNMPRAIAIDQDGFIWIGFYDTGALMKYSFDGTTLNPVFEEPLFNDGSKLNFYEMKFGPDGIMYISSRNSTPTRTGSYGVWSFNPGTEVFTPEWAVDSPYSLLIDSDTGQVYATSYSNQLWIKGIGTVTITGAQNLRGMAFDGLGNIWIASTTGGSGGDRICWYNIDSGASGYITLPIGSTPVGVGKDAAGLMWAVCRTDNGDRTNGGAGGYIVAFDPSTKAFVPEGYIQVGFRPYAYGEFVVHQPQLYDLCGYKLNDATGQGLEGWAITLEVWDETLAEPDWAFYGETLTGPNGKYCFSDLPAGTYRISEGFEAGWEQVFPGGDGMHEITLPADLNLIENGDFEQGNGIGFTSEYDYIASTGIQALWGEGDYAIGTDPNLYHYLWESYGDHSTGTGNLMIVNGEEFAAGKVVWSDSVTVDPGEEYTFSFWGATSYPEAYSSLEVYINDVHVDTYHAPEFLAEWTKYATTWDSGDATTANIKLICNTLVHTGNDFALDDIMLTANNLDFRNAEIYNLCGYKYGVALQDTEATDNPLAGWTISLLNSEEEIVATTITDADGHYCFEGLLAGDYKIVESFGEMNNDGFWEFDGKFWRPFSEDIIEVTLPDDATICEDPEPIHHNFFNQCFGNETAWMFGDKRFIEDIGLTSNNWGWSQSLGTLAGITTGAIITDQPIYAGAGQGDISKGYLVGWVDVSWDGAIVTWEFTPNEGAVLTNAKVWVGNTELPLVPVGKQKILTPTNSPGKLIYNDKTDFSKEAFMAIHFEAYVPCGFPIGDPIVE